MKTDCFAYRIQKNGLVQCRAINDLDCHSGKCNFYKPQKQLEAEHKATAERITSLRHGGRYFIEKYKVKL